MASPLSFRWRPRITAKGRSEVNAVLGPIMPSRIDAGQGRRPRRAPGESLGGAEVLSVPATPLVQHGEVVLPGDVVGGGVTGAQGVAGALRAADLQDLADTGAHLLFGAATEQIHVHAAQDGDAVAPAAVGLLHRQDLVLVGVLGVDAAFVAEVVHQLVDVATGVKNEEVPGLVGGLGALLVV